MNIYLNEDEFLSLLFSDKYFSVTYKVKCTKSLKDAAWAIAVGQSTGNPLVRNEWETESLFENHSCLILNEGLEQNEGLIKIAYPYANLGSGDGLSQLLCFIMGGQLDIDIIEYCRVVGIRLHCNEFNPSKPGINGLRAKTGCYHKPLLGAILKPKIVENRKILLEMVKQVVDGGVNWIKEDEIMGNPKCLPIYERVDALANYLSDHKEICYHFCINGDYPDLIDRADYIYKHGFGVHVNFWSGFGSYKSIRKLCPDILMHFQKSGDKILTDRYHRFGIDWNVLCDLIGRFVDTTHVGMIGGYGNDDPEIIHNATNSLWRNNCLPALSCGLHPGIVNHIITKVGNDVLLNCGGAIHGHPGGSYAGAKAMRDAIDGVESNEYLQAIDKWGYVR